MGELLADRGNMVQIKGIKFPIDCIRAAMLETGGLIVADPDLNKQLDRAMSEHFALHKDAPQALIIEKEPGIAFIPKRVTMHDRLIGTDKKTNIFLYFAVAKQYHA